MCLLNYEYMVLKNAFLVYKQNIKSEKTQIPSTTIQDIRNTNQIIANMIKNELHAIYGKREDCSL